AARPPRSSSPRRSATLAPPRRRSCAVTMAIERIPLNDAAIAADGEPRIADARQEHGEEELDRNRRPSRLAEFVNQRQVTDQLGVFIEAARRREEALRHLLLPADARP